MDTPKKRKSTVIVGGQTADNAPRPSTLVKSGKSKRSFGDELRKSVPIVSSDPVKNLWQGIETRARTNTRDGIDNTPVDPPRVSSLALVSHATCYESFLMTLGLLFAAITGFGVPAWLILLASSLDTFNNIATIGRRGGAEAIEGLLQEQLLNLIMGFALVGVICLITGSLYVAIWTYTGERQSLRIKERFVNSALHQDAAWFDKNNREELPTSIANSMIYINGAIGRQLPDLFSNVVSAAGCLGVALFLNTDLALIMLAVIPVVAIAVAILSCFIRKSSRQANEKLSAAGAVATETISGIKTVASLKAERWALDMYEKLVADAQKHSVWGGILSGLATGTTGFLFYCTYAVAFIFGTYQIATYWHPACVLKQFIPILQEEFDKLPQWVQDMLADLIPTPPPEWCSVSGADVMVCIYGVILGATYFGLMSPGLQAVNLGRQAAASIFDTIKRVPPIDIASEHGEQLSELKGGLTLDGIFFAYPSRMSNPIFKDISLTIEPGQSVALVGPSGSGKSTISKLLLRFYDPVGGNVLVDGVPLRSLNVSWWRKQVGYVAQEPTLFPGTMADNIKAGKPDATSEEVTTAAKQACCHDFIMDLPDGYDTFYSGTSIQLSGGQMQRISIARAIIRNPAILLLDEATSALDTNSERQVQEALANIRKLKSMTTVTIAHRLSTIISSDQIAVIANGYISELGTHRELLMDGGIYADLCESQGITLTSSNIIQPQEEEGIVPEGALMISKEVSVKDGSSLPQSSRDLENGHGGEIKKGEGEDKDKVEPEKEEMASVSRLWEYGKADSIYTFMGLLGALVLGALPPSEGIITAYMVANFYMLESEEMKQTNYRLALWFLAFAGASLLGNLALGWGFSVSGYRLTGRMRVLAFNSIVRRPMGWFDIPEHSTGELTSRLEEDAELVSKVTGWSLGYRVKVLATLLAGLLIALAFSWQVGLAAVLCVPIIMGAAILQALCVTRKVDVQEGALSSATVLEQGLRGISAVQAYDLQDKVFDDYSKSLEPAVKRKVKEGFIAGLVFGFSQFAVFGSFAILFYVGSVLLLQVKIGFVEFFTSVLAVIFGALAIAQTNAGFTDRQEGMAAAARIFNLVDEPLDSTDPFSDIGKKPDNVKGAISFNSCWFAYPTRPNKMIYYPTKDRNGFSLDIKPKESVAFVGKSGCGKSTALQLVLRFYEVTGGDVTLDDQNVQDMNVAWLRGNIGYVGQQPVLFAGTIRDNILLGKKDATENEIIQASIAANAHEFIEKLSHGYDTDIGTGGSLLSGGQKQRIAIARAIVKNPKILVLDEATSALDNESEKVVQAALDDLQAKQPRTTLVVAHRLLTVKGCDKIAVLDKGGVKELGSHDELLRQKGLYHDLWTKQVG